MDDLAPIRSKRQLIIALRSIRMREVAYLALINERLAILEPRPATTRKNRRIPAPPPGWCPHPDRPVLARGCCQNCYHAHRNSYRALEAVREYSDQTTGDTT